MIYHLPNELRLFFYALLLIGLALQSYLFVLQGLRRLNRWEKGRELFYLILQLGLVLMATYNLCKLTRMGVSDQLWISVLGYPIFFILFLRSVVIFYRDSQKVKDEITHFSILESLNKLESGLMIYSIQGQILLKNHKMEEMGFALFGRDYRDGNLLWSHIIQRAGIGADQDAMRIVLQEGSRFLEFTRDLLWMQGKPYIILMLKDITRIYQQKRIIEKKNQDLTRSYLEVEQMLENVKQVAELEEKLKLKVHLHDGLGYQYSILRYMFYNYSQREYDLDQIKPAELLEQLSMASSKTPEEQIGELIEFYIKMGIQIEIHGKIPSESEVAKAFSLITVEGITNAILHGNAKRIAIRFDEDLETYHLSIENDGLPAEEKVVEGGGIRGMRYRLAPIGGELQIQSMKPFTLLAVVKKANLKRASKLPS
ncbi:MAG: hypothetical protein Q4G61_11180 [Tissierellia bacterium]|nr:hypothetical protein [Tissierellia bacterium]